MKLSTHGVRMRSMVMMAALASAGALMAQESPRFQWVQGQVGFLSQENSTCVKDSLGFGLGAGQWLSSPHWGWEASYLHSRLTRQGDLWKASEDHLDATVLYRPWELKGRWIPFLRAGLGASQLEAPLSLASARTTRLNVLGGVGTQILLSPHSLGTLELRSTSVQTSIRRQEFQALVGYGYRWGASAPASAPKSTPTPLPPPPVAAPAPEPVKAPEPAPVVAPAPAPVPPPPTPTPAPAPMPTLPRKIVLGEAVLHFPNNGDALGGDAEKAIAEVADQLKAYPGEYTLVVSGHTSSLGSKAHNKALSLRRAQSVAKVLITSGVPAARIQAVGMGPDQPVADNKTREGQSRNRRVEIDIKTADQVEKTRKETGTVDPAAAPKAPAKALKKAKR